MHNCFLKTMPTFQEKNKDIADSMVPVDGKRLKQIRELAQTKFGDALIKTSLNRIDECFEVCVNDTVTETDVQNFEKMWTMCKVQVFKPLIRKK